MCHLLLDFHRKVRSGECCHREQWRCWRARRARGAGGPPAEGSPVCPCFFFFSRRFLPFFARFSRFRGDSDAISPRFAAIFAALRAWTTYKKPPLNPCRGAPGFSATPLTFNCFLFLSITQLPSLSDCVSLESLDISHNCLSGTYLDILFTRVVCAF